MTTPIAPARPDTHALLEGRLRALESRLDDQLRTLPTFATDDVAAAHRASVQRTHEEVRQALRLHAEGRYGTCIRCADPISLVRLQARPWATRCIRCADRVGW
jgi:RNA polymerase-binding transcription factor